MTYDDYHKSVTYHRNISRTTKNNESDTIT